MREVQVDGREGAHSTLLSSLDHKSITKQQDKNEADGQKEESEGGKQVQLDCPSVTQWDYFITFAAEVQF